MKMTI